MRTGPTILVDRDAGKSPLAEQALGNGLDRRQRIILAGWTLAYFLTAMIVSIMSQGPPSEVPANVPADEFSSRRAFLHVLKIASQPHPAGSPEAAQVRAYLEHTIDSMGIARTTQTANFTKSTGGSGEIANVAARLKGSGQPGLKAILLMAHYDSVPVSPGAADDGSGVAALLETLRALRAGPIPKRDIIVLFTDGEEVGLIGSILFVGESRGGYGAGHPWMADVGLVINIEAAGHQGPCRLFETSDQNGWLIREFARADPLAIGNSLTPALGRILGNTTDLKSFRSSGVPALNLGFIEGKESYHTPLDTPNQLDGRSLQHQGLHALTLARHFGNLDQDDPGEPDVIFFNPVGHWFLVYPGSWVKPLAIAAALLYPGVVVLGWRAGRVKAGGLAVGVLVLPVAIFLGTVAAWGVWWLLKLARSEADWQTIGGPVSAGLFGVALVVFVAIYGLLWKRMGVDGLDLGALGWWTIGTIVLAWLLPEGSFITLWPLVFRLATTAIAWRIPRPLAAILLSDLGALPTITILGAGAYAMFASLGLSATEVEVVVGLLVPSAILPQLSRLFDLGSTSTRNERIGMRA